MSRSHIRRYTIQQALGEGILEALPIPSFTWLVEASPEARYIGGTRAEDIYVDWGDGNEELITPLDDYYYVHSYALAGTYTARILYGANGIDYLDVSADKIIAIDGFGGFTTLEFVYFEFGSFTSFPSSIGDAPILLQLWLTSNQIADIDEDAIAKLLLLQRFQMADNGMNATLTSQYVEALYKLYLESGNLTHINLGGSNAAAYGTYQSGFDDRSTPIFLTSPILVDSVPTTQIEVTSVVDILAGDDIWVGTELMTVNSVDSGTLLSVTRGAGGSSITAHASGSRVWNSPKQMIHYLVTVEGLLITHS